jgi:hypothetical protein
VLLTGENRGKENEERKEEEIYSSELDSIVII